MTLANGVELIQQMNAMAVPPDCLAIWGLGQMGVAVKGGNGRIIYIDPILSNVVALREPALADKFTRAFPAPLEPSQINNAALVLCTHEHLDHTDPLTLGPLAAASPQACFIASGWAQTALDEAGIANARRIIPNSGKPLEFGSLRINIVPSAHYGLEFDQPRGWRWMGFHIQWNGVTFYHSGDNILYPGYLQRLQALPSIDVGLLAVNGRDECRESEGVIGNMHPQEAVWLAKELDWDMLLGGHNDLFLWNSLPATSLSDAVSRINPHQKFQTLQPGEMLLYRRNAV
ncbi:MAG: MBL fold metallo-hydrolase [Anaerolineaceae bacterium]|nr:MBL fold metallo-hydrolase [Anaerolineaceae bacterium]